MRTYKNYGYKITVQHHFGLVFHAYVIIKPNQKGYNCPLENIQNSDDELTRLIIDEKDKDNNRIIGFDTRHTRKDSPYAPTRLTSWNTQKVTQQCQMIIDYLLIAKLDRIADDVFYLMNDLKSQQEFNDVDLDYAKDLDTVLNTKASHKAFKLMKKDVDTDDGDDTHNHVCNALSDCLAYSNISIFGLIKDFS